MADHGDTIAARLILLGQKRSAQDRLHTENREQVGGDVSSEQRFRRIRSGEIEWPWPAGADLIEDRVLFAPIQEVGIRHPVAPAGRSWVGHPDLNESLLLRIRQRPEHHRIYDTENR